MSDMYIPSVGVGGWQAAVANTAASLAGKTAGAIGNVAENAASAIGSTAESVTNPFASVLQSALQQTGALESKATSAVTGLLNGSGVEVQDAMLATDKADMAFELALQVRNKAVAAYQQMMGMQF